LSFFISKKISVPVTIYEKASATGAAAITPQRPQLFPKINIQGIRAIHCRIMERKIDIVGRPVTTKRFVDTT
jgi:hypothetical protein